MAIRRRSDSRVSHTDRSGKLLDYIDIREETDLAIEFEFTPDNFEWIPKSQIIDHDENSKVVEVTPWIADKKGL